MLSLQIENTNKTNKENGFIKDIHYILIATLVDIALSTCVEPTVTGSPRRALQHALPRLHSLQNCPKEVHWRTPPPLNFQRLGYWMGVCIHVHNDKCAHISVDSFKS